MTLEEYELYELTKPSFIQNVNFSTEAKHRDPVEPLVQGRNGISHEEDTPVEAQVICRYNITSTKYGTMLYTLGGATGMPLHDEKFSEMEIDGVLQDELRENYQFETTGEHTVKFTLIDPTDIGPSFASMSDLVSITMPNTITAIDEYAFYSSGLTNVTIPASVESISNKAFGSCGDLTSITFLSDVAPDMELQSTSESPFSDQLPDNGTLIVPDNDSYDDLVDFFETYYSGWTITHVPPTSETKIVCEYDITDISSPVWLYCSEWESTSEYLPIDQSFSEIEVDGEPQQIEFTSYELDTAGKHIAKFSPINSQTGTFRGCDELVSVIIPSTITNLSVFDAFASCSNLTTITFIPTTAPVEYGLDDLFENISDTGTLIVPNNDSYSDIIDYFEEKGWTIIRYAS